jgi:FkbM family methyltransferase
MDFSGIPNQSVLGRALRAPLGLLPKGARARILQGPLRGKQWIVGAHTHGCWLGSYEFTKQALFAKLVKPGAVVYDVGANAGFYTLLAALRAGPTGRVVAFEPLPRNLYYLQEHVRLNATNRVVILDVAVAKGPGTSRFYSTRGSAQGSLSDEGDIEVRTTSLDSLVASRVVPPPTLIKMDIEGNEFEALDGAQCVLRDYAPTILLATHGSEVHRACIALLRECNYEIRPVTGSSIDDSDELLATPRAREQLR